MTVEPAKNASAESNKMEEAAYRRLTLTPGSQLSILTIRWGCTVSVGNFSSVRLDAEAVVPMGGSAESTLEELREWVLSQSPLNEYDRDRMVEATARLRQDERICRDKLADAQYEYEKIRKAFKTMGIEPGLPNPTDLPF